jgi:hypothetical protein
VGDEILRSTRLPEHDLVKPPSHIQVRKAEGMVWTAPVKPNRQIDGTLSRPSEILKAGNNHGTAT